MIMAKYEKGANLYICSIPLMRGRTSIEVHRLWHFLGSNIRSKRWPSLPRSSPLPSLQFLLQLPPYMSPNVDKNLYDPRPSLPLRRSVALLLISSVSSSSAIVALGRYNPRTECAATIWFVLDILGAES